MHINSFVLLLSVASAAGCGSTTSGPVVSPNQTAPPSASRNVTSANDPMATTAFGKKLWSVIGKSEKEALAIFGPPNGKSKWGKGYSIPGYQYNYMGALGPFIHLDRSQQDTTEISCMIDLPVPSTGQIRASFIFQKIGWNIKLWKSEQKKVDRGGYSETLSYKGVEFSITVMPSNDTDGDSHFNIRIR